MKKIRELEESGTAIKTALKGAALHVAELIADNHPAYL